jgi:hypothetical protein
MAHKVKPNSMLCTEDISKTEWVRKSEKMKDDEDWGFYQINTNKKKPGLLYKPRKEKFRPKKH